MIRIAYLCVRNSRQNEGSVCAFCLDLFNSISSSELPKPKSEGYSGKSPHTVKCYRSEVLHFFKEFESEDISSLTKAQIEQYMYRLKTKHKISDTKQNQIINAIKFYLEKVLKLPRTKYDLTRPKKSQTLPDTLPEDDVFKLINILPNVKHKSILHLLYSSGLRRVEINNLRIEDVYPSHIDLRISR